MKEILVMTSFGPVPYKAVKPYLCPNVTKELEEFVNKLTEVKEPEIPTNLAYYVNALAEKKGWKPKRMERFLIALKEIDVAAVFSILLREVAVKLDEQHEGTINHSEKVYSVGLTNGHIFEVDKKHIKNYRNFAAFRTLEDAKMACSILRNLLNEMFKSEHK